MIRHSELVSESICTDFEILNQVQDDVQSLGVKNNFGAHDASSLSENK
jgi:hypothetical protein